MLLPVPPSGVPLAGIHFELTRGQPIIVHASFKRHVADDFLYVRFVQKVNNKRGTSGRVVCVTPHAVMLCTPDGNITRFVPMSCILDIHVAPLASRNGPASRVYIKTVPGMPDLLLDLEYDSKNLGSDPSELPSIIARVKSLRGEWHDGAVKEARSAMDLRQMADLKKPPGFKLPESKAEAIQMEKKLLAQAPAFIEEPPTIDSTEVKGADPVTGGGAHDGGGRQGMPIPAAPSSPASPELTFVEPMDPSSPQPVFAGTEPIPPPTIYSLTSPQQPQHHPPPSSYYSHFNDEPAWIPQMPWFEVPERPFTLGGTSKVPGSQFTFPADRDFWDNFITEFELFKGSGDPPHYVITTSHSDGNLVVNQGFLEMFIQGWEAANPNTVVLMSRGLEQSFKACDEFIDFFELHRNRADRSTELVVQYNNGHPIRIDKQEWKRICMAWEEAKRVTAGDKQRLFNAKRKEIKRRKEVTKTPLTGGSGNVVVATAQTHPVICVHCGKCATGDLQSVSVSSPVNPISVVASPISVMAGQAIPVPVPPPSTYSHHSPAHTAGGASRGMFWTAFMHEWERARSHSPSHHNRTSPPRSTYNPVYGTPVAL